MDIERKMTDGKIEDMERLRPGRGRYAANSKGEVVPVDSSAVPERVSSALPPPDGVVVDPTPVMGPTQIGEWLLTDVRVAKAVQPDSHLFEICRSLVERGHCGIVESTLIIDLLGASKDDRLHLLSLANWPAPPLN